MMSTNVELQYCIFVLSTTEFPSLLTHSVCILNVVCIYKTSSVKNIKKVYSEETIVISMFYYTNKKTCILKFTCLPEMP